MTRKLTCEELEQRIKELEGKILEHRHVEKELRENEKDLKAIFDAIGEGIGVFDITGKIVKINKRIVEVGGYSEEEIIGKRIGLLKMFPPKSLLTMLFNFSKLISGNETPRFEIEAYRKTGEKFNLELHGSPLRKRGRIVGMVGIMRDISQRKRAEEALRKSEETARVMLNATTDIAALIGLDGTVVACNDKLPQSYGLTLEEIIGKNILDFLPPDIAKNRKARAGEAIQSGKPVQHRDELGGRKFEHYIYPVVDAKGHVAQLVIFTNDHTEEWKVNKEKEELQEKLARLNRMEALGLLAGGVAHDLNNILSGIVSYPELMLMDLPEGHKLRKPLEIIQESGKGAATVVSDLLTLARGVASDRETVNLNSIVKEYLLSPEFKKLEHFHPTITLKADFDLDLLNIKGSQVHIRRAIMNLVMNAFEAIGNDGKVTISTRNQYLDKPMKVYDQVCGGEYAVLSVSDDGMGIPKDDLERIFEPFYSKKVIGRSGTGLGLAVVWSTIQDHEGYVNVINDENGTTFELYFPITRDEVSYKDPSVLIEDCKGNGQKILVIDDIDSQREVGCKMLNILGYKTKAVGSGEEAVEYLKEHSVDLIVLDMIMDPGIDGLETYKRILELHPGQKAIIVSGFSETGPVKEAKRLGVGAYVKKPFLLESIGLAIRDELAKQKK